MKKLILSTILLCLIWTAQGQTLLEGYLPQDVNYDLAIPTPEEILGYEVGEWHVSHDQLVSYMRELARVSDRIALQEYGYSYEHRPLMVLIITSPENHVNLEAIRSEHVQLANAKVAPDSDSKLVHYMGYSVHGNEASGSNAALLAAYYLAAAQGAWVDRLLSETVILLDPSFNPDGLQRFSTWVNMHKSANLVSDPSSREFDEAWPGGRTNHYWFDLNRDWMPVQHPESKGRLTLYHQWKPNILTDHHEMGSNSTFFFQPGVPSRKYPLTPQNNVTLTEKIAQYHAAALDSIGSLYYSKEGFDDFYVGKGSTYPDINGAVGILFEQASARGHLQENQFGTISFPEAIRNHFVTSLSTLKAANALKSDLLSHQSLFYREAEKLAGADPVQAYIFGSEGDPARAFHLMEILHRHDILIHPVQKNIKKRAASYSTGSYVVPTNQPQYRLIKALFETRTTFQDSLFYDVSTWTLPLAFNLNFDELGAKDYVQSQLGQAITSPVFPAGQVLGSSDYAYLFEPNGYYTHRAIMRLQKAGIVTEVNHSIHRDQNRSYMRGSIVIPVGVQREKRDIIEAVIQEIATMDGIDVYGLNTGLAIGGSDLGTRQAEVLTMPKVAVLVGDGVDGNEAGEVWHLLDQRMGMQVSLLPAEALHRADLSRYNKIVMTDGNYRSITDTGVESLKQWITRGGVIVTWKRGGKWLSDKDLSKVQYDKSQPDTTGYKKYLELDQNRGAQVVGGAIFEARMDLGHPLSYGLESAKMPLFRDHNLMMKKAANPYANPLVYTPTPLISGYISEERLKQISATPAVTISALGKGRIITFADNPNFRAFWYGTNKLFLNALFFGQTISSGAAEE
ncbi:M14 family zinc carboxypeptidase [Marinoscillum sp.]|uniref:M14 family zinc carboxypeptidase n=1 Tax=Marinoscillum sp. TaxID=2024838 RepID=UPI003BADBD42